MTANNTNRTSPANLTLPIRRLTLYKHGVGFVEREGTIGGAEIDLVFRADEVNDALKSLLVLDRRGGQVLGIHYQTPADQAVRLTDSPIKLTPDHSVLDLLRSLRGWEVRLVLGAATQVREVQGRLLGIEVPDGTTLRQALVAILEDGTAGVALHRLGELRQVVLREDRSGQDLRYFLDVSRSEEAHRTVKLRLSPGEHDLAVSYLVPSPTWRVTYRLVAESQPGASQPGEAARPDAKQGELLLQGWGLFDNRLEEDLEDVGVTLVAGQPISFIYDLAASRIPGRPVVQDEARVAAAPVEFAAAMAGDIVPAEAVASLGREEMATGKAQARSLADAFPAPAGAARGRIAQMAQRVGPATASSLGELFQYQVVAPVTVKRGESALVPILSTRLPYGRELLFNQQKLPAHPVAALRFTNETGLVLERGPVTVLENGDYHGEALVPFTKEGGEVYVPFSVELGLAVTQTSASRSETVGLRIDKALLWTKQALTTETKYLIENNLGTAERVTIEHPIWPSYDLVETRPPDAQTHDFYRWIVPCPPRQRTSFSVCQRHYTWEQQQLLDQAYAALLSLLEAHWLDQATLERIRKLLNEKQQMAKNVAEIDRLQAERQQIYEREEHLRQNLAALSSSGDEAALRQHVFTQLQASEERLNAIERRIAPLAQENQQRQGALEAELSRLNVPETTQATTQATAHASHS